MKVFSSSLNAHDFLLAAMIVCLDLWYGAEAEGSGRGSADLYTWGLERRGDMIRALEISAEIWAETRDQSMEAYKAHELISVMVKKLQSPKNQGSRQPQSPFPFPGMGLGGATNGAFIPPVEEKPEHSAAMTLGMLSNGGMTPNSANMFNNGFSSAPGLNSSMADTQKGVPAPNFSLEQSANGTASAPSPMAFVGNDPLDMTNIDWVRFSLLIHTQAANRNAHQEAWDSYIQNAAFDGVNQAWPMQVDMPTATPGLDGQAPQAPMQQGVNPFGNAGGFFMGSDTAGGMPI